MVKPRLKIKKYFFLAIIMARVIHEVKRKPSQHRRRPEINLPHLLLKAVSIILI